MIKKKPYVLATIIIICIVVFTANYFISNRVEDKINAALSKDFIADVDAYNVNLFNSSIVIQNIQLTSKNSKKDSIQARIKTAKANFSSIWNLINGDTLKISTVLIDYPKVSVYQSKQKDSTKANIKKPIQVAEFQVNNGSIAVTDTAGILKSSSKNFSITLENIHINNQKKTFEYSVKEMRFSQCYQTVSNTQELFMDDVLVTPKTIQVNNLHLKPLYSKQEYIKHIKYQRDWMNLNAKKVVLKDYDIDFHTDTKIFSAATISLDSVDFQLYRDKIKPRNFQFKPLYSRMLREANIDIIVDTLTAKHTAITYMEKLPKRDQYGQLLFDNMDILITDIDNTKAKTDTKIDVNCSFLGDASLHVDWAFDIQNENDQFTIQGTLGNLSASHINKFLTPNMNVKVQGTIASLFFNFYGNNTLAKGELSMKFDDFKVALLKENGEEKKKFLSAVANLFVHTKHEHEAKQIEVERVQYKSFFNYLWLCVEDGAIKSFL